MGTTVYRSTYRQPALLQRVKRAYDVHTPIIAVTIAGVAGMATGLFMGVVIGSAF